MSAARGPAADAVEASLAAIAADGRSGVWIDRVSASVARAAAGEVDRRVAAGDHLPLAGTTVSVKGNVDVAGLDTTAGCPAFARRPARSAAAVRRLVDAGAVVMGTTNLDQFATGLVGTRSPYGICPNAHWDQLISGGSSSGAAVAVAAGMVDVSVGTDTAGSGRVPAAANGIVGLKPTRGLVSTAGIVPACASLDCVAFLARDIETAATAMGIASGFDRDDPWSRVAPAPASSPAAGAIRVGIAAAGALDFDGDAGRPALHAAATEAAAAILTEGWAAGCSTEEVSIDDLLAAGRLLYDGAFVAERYAAVGPFVAAHPEAVDPVVGPIIAAAGTLPAWRLAADRTRLAAHGQRARDLFARVDVLVVPSVPRVPTVADVLADPIDVNSMLGTYTNFVNLLDLCAVALPIPPVIADPDAPPASLTFIAPAWRDQVLVSLAATIERGLASRPSE